MKKFFFLSLLIPGFAIAQDYNLSEFIWEENPVREILEPGLLKEHFIILHEKRILEYAFDQEDELSLFETYHKKVRVNDDGAIQRFNKVYISLSDVVDIIDIKARTITKEGKIIEVDKASIKELVNLGDYGDYKIFAIEGLEKESDLEYFYKLKKKVVFYERMYMQSDGHIGNSELSIITPEYLIFKTKSYNGYPMLKDTIVDGKRIMAGTVKNIPPLNEEKYAAYRSNLMRVDIKFSYNAIYGTEEKLTWDDAAEEYYESIYDFEKKEIKKAKSIIARLKIDNINEDGRIKTIDNYIKNNYVIQEVEVEPDDLTYILENKVASNNGMVMLYALLLQEAGVDHEIGFTSDRFNARFDKDFMSRFFFEKYIIYFPGQLKFLIPTDQFYRYPLIPHELTFNDGLFMQPVTLGKRKTAIANIVSIPSDDVNMSYGDRFIDISFENRFKKVKVSVNQQLAGHLGVGIQPYLSFFSPDEQDDIITDLIRSIGKDAVILNYVVSNMDIDKSLIEKPFTIESELIVNSLLEKAGDNYLFNIGNVIGQQVEMYQDRERQNDVEMTYPHRYLRVINVDIPDGYVIKNLDELIIDITYPTNEEPTMSFTSNYELKDNKLTITVKEFYTESRYPVDQFEQYREVINGAADFNKIVLLIEKE